MKPKTKMQVKSGNDKMKRHRRSMQIVIAVLLLLIAVISVDSALLHTKSRAYRKQKAELKRQIAEEDQRTEDIAEYEKYVKTDEYIEDTAKQKAGLAHDNEILFKAEK